MKDRKTKTNASLISAVIVVGFLVLFVLTRAQWTLWCAGIIGLASLASTYMREKIALYWIKLGHILGFVFPPVILSFIYLFCLTPLALLARLFQKEDSLMLRNKYLSTFKLRNRSILKESFEKPW